MQEFRIIKETSDWLAIDKPRGISVHNQAGNDLVSFVKQYLSLEGKSYPINRIDSGTAGIVLFAKHADAARHLQQSFEKRLVQKTYQAKVQILKNPPAVGDHGLWRWPLTNRAEGRKDPKGYWGKRIPCKTEWRVMSVDETTAILEINLLTGRKHQIRRHCAIYGWPISGDPRYGLKETKDQGGHNLIAKNLTFTDPSSGEAVTVCSEASVL